ncbi:MAG TPA: hypothetical protein VIC06_04340 [Solirubrobacteraceae bacterium]
MRQGRTDAWVAHQLEVTVQEIEQFKRQNELDGAEDPTEGAAVLDYPDEIDLRAEDDALIAAELEEAAREAERAEAEAKAKAEAEAAERAARGEDEEPAEDEAGDGAPKTRRRGRRGGRTRRSAPRESGPLEGTFDHGEEGYGLWLDPAVQDNPIYAEHWAGHRSVEVLVEEDQIVIKRVGEDD